MQNPSPGAEYFQAIRGLQGILIKGFMRGTIGQECKDTQPQSIDQIKRKRRTAFFSLRSGLNKHPGLNKPIPGPGANPTMGKRLNAHPSALRRSGFKNNFTFQALGISLDLFDPRTQKAKQRPF
jgi:hypothetical protein